MPCAIERWKRALLSTLFLCTVLVYAVLMHRIQLPEKPLPRGAVSTRTSETAAPRDDVRESRGVVNPHPYSYVLNKPRLCDVPEDLLLVVLVPSACNNFQQRRVIRSTWGDASVKHGFKVAFLLGYPKIKAVQPMIVAEDRAYRDIIQEDFADVYANLALKSVMMVRWVSQHCSHTRFVLKIDDDMLLNVWGLWAELQAARPAAITMWGMLAVGWTPNRNPASKWYLPARAFKRSVLPPFLTGPAYLFTGDCAPLLYATSLTVPYVHLEDVFLTGIVAEEAGIRRQHHGGFLNYGRLFKPCSKPYQIASHGYRPVSLLVIWKTLAPKNATFRCDIDHGYPALLVT